MLHSRCCNEWRGGLLSGFGDDDSLPHSLPTDIKRQLPPQWRKNDPHLRSRNLGQHESYGCAPNLHDLLNAVCLQSLCAATASARDLKQDVLSPEV